MLSPVQLVGDTNSPPLTITFQSNDGPTLAQSGARWTDVGPIMTVAGVVFVTLVFSRRNHM